MQNNNKTRHSSNQIKSIKIHQQLVNHVCTVHSFSPLFFFNPFFIRFLYFSYFFLSFSFFFPFFSFCTSSVTHILTHLPSLHLTKLSLLSPFSFPFSIIIPLSPLLPSFSFFLIFFPLFTISKTVQILRFSFSFSFFFILHTCTHVYFVLFCFTLLYFASSTANFFFLFVMFGFLDVNLWFF